MNAAAPVIPRLSCWSTCSNKTVKSVSRAAVDGSTGVVEEQTHLSRTLVDPGTQSSSSMPGLDGSVVVRIPLTAEPMVSLGVKLPQWGTPRGARAAW